MVMTAMGTLNSTYNELDFNEIWAITKENLHTKYTPFTYNDIHLNEKLPIMKQNLCIFFFPIGRVECIWLFPRPINMFVLSTTSNICSPMTCDSEWPHPMSESESEVWIWAKRHPPANHNQFSFTTKNNNLEILKIPSYTLFLQYLNPNKKN